MIYAEQAPDDENLFQITDENIPYRFVEVMKLIPSAKWKKGRWLLAKEWPVAIALKNEFQDELTISPELMEWMNSYYTDQIVPAYQLRDQVSAEDIFPGMYPHQNADALFLSTIKKGILGNGMGSGKTQSSIATLKYLSEVKGENVFPALVVGPSSTKYSWEKEFKRVWPEVKVKVIDGTAAKKRKQFLEFHEEEADVLIMNWESLRLHSRLKPFGATALKKCTDCGGLDPKVKVGSCEVHNKELQEIEFRSAIADEAHRMSDPSSKQARALKAATHEAEFKFAMSGTPILDNLSDLFSMLNWLYPEAYPSKVKFIDRFFDVSVNHFGASTILGVKRGMEREFFQCIDPIMRRMPKEVILPFLPPIVRTKRVVEMSAKQKKAYEQMKEKSIALLDDDDIVFTTSALVQSMRLLQFASAFGEIEERMVFNKNSPTPEVKELKEFLVLSSPSSKIDAFLEDLPDYGGSSLVVFANSTQLIRLLAKKLDDKGIQYGLITGDQDNLQRQAYMDAFQSGGIKLILVNIQAGGTGITLTAADTAIFLQRSWSMVNNEQAEGRVHRIGSEVFDQINIVDYVTEDTIESLVFEANDRKMGNLEYLFRDKELIRKVLEADTSALDMAPEESYDGSLLDSVHEEY